MERVWAGKDEVNGSGNGSSGGASSSFFIGPIIAGGQDVTDTGIVVPESGPSLEVIVTVDFRAATVTGKTLDAEDKPLTNANLALIRADSNKRLLPPYSPSARSAPAG